MAPLCREFGISRVTGYKIYERYKTCGLDGLNDRSLRPYRHANKLPYQVERTIPFGDALAPLASRLRNRSGRRYSAGGAGAFVSHPVQITPM